MTTADIEGTLDAMDLPALVQFASQGGDQTLIRLERNTYIGELYLDGKTLCHAELYEPNGNSVQIGEEVVYELLSWETGTFKVRKNIQLPKVTIQTEWTFLLMEGLRQLDERRYDNEENLEELEDNELLSDLLAEMSTEDAAKLKDLIKQNREYDMANISKTLDEIMKIDGALGAALVDWESGLTLGTAGSGLNIELAAAGNTNVVRAKQAVMKDLRLKGGIEDILITLTEQYHLIRMLSDSAAHLFLYVAMDRTHANLGLARHKLIAIEHELEL